MSPTLSMRSSFCDEQAARPMAVSINSLESGLGSSMSGSVLSSQLCERDLFFDSMCEETQPVKGDDPIPKTSSRDNHNDNCNSSVPPLPVRQFSATGSENDVDRERDQSEGEQQWDPCRSRFKRFFRRKFDPRSWAWPRGSLRSSLPVNSASDATSGLSGSRSHENIHETISSRVLSRRMARSQTFSTTK